jgi:membrane protein implicated in regulation of membrane protease activity
MIWAYIQTLGAWNWIVLGLILLGIEVMAPGTFILWLGVAALFTGLFVFVADPGWQTQFIVFGVLSLIAVIAWWFYFRNRGSAASDPILHRRSEMYIGRVCTLDGPLASGSGRVRIEDTVWRVTGPDLPAGARVRVTGADGAVLQVVEA